MMKPCAEPAQPSLTLLEFQELYFAHAPFIARVIERLTGGNGHVDDLLQETFVAAFRSWPSYERDIAAPSTWLYGIALNHCRRHLRASRRFAAALARLAGQPRSLEEPAAERQLAENQQKKLVHDALKKLPLKQREVFVLFELEELEGREIAAMLDLAEGTVWTRLHHARKRFASVVERAAPRENMP